MNKLVNLAKTDSILPLKIIKNKHVKPVMKDVFGVSLSRNAMLVIEDISYFKNTMEI